VQRKEAVMTINEKDQHKHFNWCHHSSCSRTLPLKVDQHASVDLAESFESQQACGRSFCAYASWEQEAPAKTGLSFLLLVTKQCKPNFAAIANHSQVAALQCSLEVCVQLSQSC